MNNQEMQELLRHHPELKNFFVFVNRRSGGFWRRKPRSKPKWYSDRGARTKAQLGAQLELGTAGFKSFGQHGFDMKGVPIVASNVKKTLEGKKYTIPKWQRIAEELRKSLREVAIVVESKE